MWGSAASVAGVVFTVFSVFVDLPRNNPVPTAKLDEVLSQYLEELADIEDSWEEKYKDVEAVAGRVAAVLKSRFPENSERIQTLLSTTKESEELLQNLRQQIKEVQDRLLVEHSSANSSK